MRATVFPRHPSPNDDLHVNILKERLHTKFPNFFFKIVVLKKNLVITLRDHNIQQCAVALNRQKQN